MWFSEDSVTPYFMKQLKKSKIYNRVISRNNDVNWSPISSSFGLRMVYKNNAVCLENVTKLPKTDLIGPATAAPS